MDKELLEKCINEGMSLSDIKNETNKSISSVRHWLKKYGLKTCRHKNSEKKDNICVLCKKPVYKNGTLCGRCHSKVNRYRYRLALVKYLGGKCSKCGYNKNISVLEFHHINADDKDFTLSAGIRNWHDMKKEVSKCILLCANCHREEHASDYWFKIIDICLEDYKGNNKELKDLLK